VRELRTAELSFFHGTAGVEGPPGPLLQCRTALPAADQGGAGEAGYGADPVVARLLPHGTLKAGEAAGILLRPRAPGLLRAMRALPPAGLLVYLPPVLQVGLHWLARQPRAAGVSPAQRRALSSVASGWLLALPKLQSALAARPAIRPRDPALADRLRGLLARSYWLGIGLDDLAAQLGVGRCALNRGLRAATGLSVARYRTELRLRQAAAGLLDDPRPCADWARRVGYRSAAQFSLDFSRLYGVPPSRLIGLVDALVGTTLAPLRM